MRKTLHFILNAIGFVFWVILMVALAITTWIAVLGDKVWPNADMGSCWTYSLPRLVKRGGYLLIRPADGQMFFGFLPVLHAAWVKVLGKSELEYFHPVHRRSSVWMPWHTFYYKGVRRTVEHNHDSVWRA